MFYIFLRSSFLAGCFFILMTTALTQKGFSVPINYDGCRDIEAIESKAKRHYAPDLKTPNSDDVQNLIALMKRIAHVTGLKTDGTLNQKFLTDLIEEWTSPSKAVSPTKFSNAQAKLFELNEEYLQFFGDQIGFNSTKSIFASVIRFLPIQQETPIQLPKGTLMGVILPKEVKAAQFLFDLVYDEILRLNLLLYLPSDDFVRSILYYVSPDDKGATQRNLWPYYAGVERFYLQLQSLPPQQDTSPSKTLSLRMKKPPVLPTGDCLPSPSLCSSMFSDLLSALSKTPRDTVTFLRKDQTVHVRCTGELKPDAFFIFQEATNLETLQRRSSPHVRSFNPDLHRTPRTLYRYLEQQLSSQPPPCEVQYSQVKIPQLEALLPWFDTLIKTAKTVHFQHMGIGRYDGGSYHIRIAFPDKTDVISKLTPLSQTRFSQK